MAKPTIILALDLEDIEAPVINKWAHDVVAGREPASHEQIDAARAILLHANGLTAQDVE